MAPLRPVHYWSLVRSTRWRDWQAGFLRRYVLGRGHYPYLCQMKVGLRSVDVMTYCQEDLFTVNEVFALECYGRLEGARTIVDLGANIGVAASYFLAVAPHSAVYCVEPLETNLQRLAVNTASYGDRVKILPCAAYSSDCELEFGVESTGRYSGINCKSKRRVKVIARDIRTILREVLANSDRIDLLKIDIEGAEGAVVTSIPSEIFCRIGEIYIEGDAFEPEKIKAEGFLHRHSFTGVHRFWRESGK